MEEVDSYVPPRSGSIAELDAALVDAIEAMEPMEVAPVDVYRVMGVTHSRYNGEKLYWPSEAEGMGFRVSYRVFRGLPLTPARAIADCPTVDAARAACRLLSGGAS